MLAPGEGFEPPWCRINSAVPYQLGDPGMEPTGGFAPPLAVYETAVLLLDDAGMEGAAGVAPAHSGFADRRVSISPDARMLVAGPGVAPAVTGI